MYAMWRVIPLAVALAAVCPGVRANPPSTLEGSRFLTTPGEEWKLVWNDEFEGDKLDASKWSIGLSWKGDDGTNRYHNTQYASYIMDDDVQVKDGVLNLLTQRRDVTNPSGKVYHFTEGLIQTSGKFSGTYGYYEARIRIPVEAGPGLWPAFWMLPKGWPPEMDINEVWTGGNRNHQGLAYRAKDGGVGWDDYNTNTPLPTGFHTYGMEWGPGYQIYNIDGKVMKGVYGDRVPPEPMYILLNSGVESAHLPNVGTVFPNSYQVDYVRVYQRPPVPTVLNGGFENDELAPWSTSTGILAVNYGARSGKRALRIDSAPASCEQRIFGLNPNTAYSLSGWARVTGSDDEARMGVKEYGGAEVSKSVTSTRYSEASVDFTTGAEATTAIIYCWKPAGSGSAFFDDIRLTER